VLEGSSDGSRVTTMNHEKAEGKMGEVSGGKKKGHRETHVFDLQYDGIANSPLFQIRD